MLDTLDSLVEYDEFSAEKDISDLIDCQAISLSRDEYNKKCMFSADYYDFL